MKNRKLKLGFAALSLLAACGYAQAQDAKTIVRASSGGSFGEALRKVCDEPFTKETGIVVQPANTDDSTPQIRAQMLTGNVIWDISNTSAETLPIAAESGWLEKIDWDLIDPEHKLPDIARQPYGVGINSYSEIIVVRTDKLPEGKQMTSWADFWDTKTFPGPRSLHDTPIKNLEFALLADGVKADEVYKVLASEEGVKRALDKLSELRPNITIWWTSGQQPLQLLASGEVNYATAWNGRVAPLQREGVPVKIVWNGGAIVPGYHSILKGSKHIEEAHKWLKYCWNDAKRGAELTKLLPYPGFAPGLMDHLPDDVKKDLPTEPENLKVQFVFDGQFWAENRATIQKAWDRWRLAGQ